MRGFCFLLNRFHWSGPAAPRTLISALRRARQEEVSKSDGAAEYQEQQRGHKHCANQPPRQLRRNKRQNE